MKTFEIDYQDNGQTFSAFVAMPAKTSKPLPAVMVAHDWHGRSKFSEDKAIRLAKLGYVGFALDLYGKGIQGKSPEENQKLMQPYIDDRALLKRRMQLALTELKKIDKVDTRKTAAIGYCFGGLCVLDLARSGAEVAGVVSFHGLLNKPNLPEQLIHSKVLVLHGYDDPMVKPEQVVSFGHEMTQAKADWQLHAYGNTLHAFSNPEANNPSFGVLYNATADKRSWQAMENFLAEIFGG